MNITWAKEIINQLVMQGVDYFCLAPGSRVTPFSIAVSEEKRAETFVHFDERALAFHALGYAKATGKPAAIFVTSGTAVGNLMPAVMEASLSRIPLIVITSDRPPELRETNANQTLDQVKVFGSFVRWDFDIPCPSPDLPDRFLATTIGQAVHRAKTAPEGPVHLNCMLREPFFVEETPLTPQAPCFYEDSKATLHESAFDEWAEKLAQIERGVIIAGSMKAHSVLSPLLKLAEKLDWPLFADIDSGLRSYGRREVVIPYYDMIFKSVKGIRPGAILHFGDRLVSKALLEWTEKNPPKTYCQIADHPLRADPKHLVTHRIFCEPSHFSEKMIQKLAVKSSWLSEWQTLSKAIEEEIELPSDELSEPGIIRWIEKHVPSEWALYFANSMPVRDAESFLYPHHSLGPIFTCRGVSGIDGNIALVAGMSEGCKRPLLAVIGDQTALYDLTSLSQLKNSSYPVIIFIINNAGGGIFSFLPVHQNTSKECFEKYFTNSHAYEFEQAASFFGLPYYHPKSWEELDEVPLTQSCVVELTTDRARNLALHQELVAQCSLGISSKT